jgi:hypothetical protein
VIKHQFGNWRLSVFDWLTQFEPDSRARAILSGQVQLFVIPVSEFGDPAEILARYSTLAYVSDLGPTNPWSADASPPVGEPRIRIPLAPSF